MSQRLHRRRALLPRPLLRRIGRKESIGDPANVQAYRANGAPMDDPPIADDETTDQVRESYLGLRAKYASGKGKRPFLPGEPRPTTIDHAAQSGPEWEISCVEGSVPTPSDTPRRLAARQGSRRVTGRR